MHDAHVHSNYSDGEFLSRMIAEAETGDVESIGFADHCYVTNRDTFITDRATSGMNFDRTYDRRRSAIAHLREASSVTIYDAVEIDYDPRDHDVVETFLEAANFDYVIGSVHRVDDKNIQVERTFRSQPDSMLDTIVETYYDSVIELIESGLVDILAHPDLPERTPALKDRVSTRQYHRVAKALESSHTVPEINAGRALSEDGCIHPRSEFREVLAEYDIEYTLGTDAHSPAELGERASFLEAFASKHGIDPLDPAELPGVRSVP